MTIIFPSVGLQAFCSILHLLGLSLLSHCLSRRVYTEGLGHSWGSIRQLTWSRLCILLIFLDSWLFMFTSGILIFGIGLETDRRACQAGILTCVAFYATSKILIYCFLVEKVHVVWSPTAVPGERWRSPIHWICFTSLLIYSAIVTLMVIGHVVEWKEDQICTIGLKAFSSIPLLSFDLYITILLNGLFLWPLFQSSVANPVIRTMAVRTLVASIAALTTSLVNIGVLTLQHGKQLGWVCLGSCGADVILNALAIFWVTLGGQNNPTIQDIETPRLTATQPALMSSLSVDQTQIPAIELEKSKDSVHSDLTTPSTMFPELGSRVGTDLSRMSRSSLSVISTSTSSPSPVFVPLSVTRSMLAPPFSSYDLERGSRSSRRSGEGV
ncbi:hypothetical protein PM082_018595 [Marasmius tenuissimus]|nr:hypothetical protein PM082_018595 [Marasmius tenuissimus]